ncbi:putative membrane-associated protein [Rubidibacter lacunae KORDI 51-2]|uniref:Putative membrane-associated protein n=1 Tax=Rubidibacter lacunae KORDI 51-2 TaxID=582515 RepID=U5DHI3_9CHRO|nr:DedA family protein [Rubidibacter lacunae]ERN40044.1 putative membrane-associated protein [Rubidibacter lacunae KORDI 51-2]
MDWLSLETWQELARSYGYGAVFLGIALENTGLPLPGETIALTGGYLAGNGELDYGRVLGSAIAGAILGDTCGYWLGRTGGWPLVVRVGSWFRISEVQLQTARDRFGRSARQAVFFGRFVTLLRIFAGPLAGIARMPYLEFLVCNAAGAAFWALAMVTLAFGLGRVVPLGQIASWVAQFGVLALVLAIAVILLAWWWETRRNRRPVGESVEQ